MIVWKGQNHDGFIYWWSVAKPLIKQNRSIDHNDCFRGINSKKKQRDCSEIKSFNLSFDLIIIIFVFTFIDIEREGKKEKNLVRYTLLSMDSNIWFIYLYEKKSQRPKNYLFIHSFTHFRHCNIVFFCLLFMKIQLLPLSDCN